MLYKIGVVGDKDSVLGFKALGLDVVPVESVDDARTSIHKMARADYAVIYLTEQLAEELEPELARYKDSLTPAIILIPGKEGTLGIGMARVTENVIRAVGADI